ncbi:NAD(P)-dependent oxidoreductase [Immundisolibacter sp.]|uniref:NAD(P)-dependent oxidoreductase n=1 Tax=Immundisolibacter sp. TaxID=1934948 RepID=UPI00356820DE
MSQHIGVIGLGSLGANMARLLAADGYAVHAYDLDAERTAAAALAPGVTAHGSARAVAAASTLVLLSLPQSEAVRAACLGAEGIVEGAARGLLVVDTTSGYPEHSKDIAAQLAVAGVRYIDAAITGEEGGAKALPKRALTFCVGGSEADVAEATPVLERMARYIYHVGPLGSGQIVKMVNNMVGSAAGVAAIEGLLIAAKHGIDVKVAAQVLDKGTGMNFFCKHPDFALARDVVGGFQLGLMTKDLRHMSEFARQSDVPALVTDHIFHLFELFVREKGYAADILRQVDVMEKWAGVQLDGTRLDAVDHKA